MRTTLLALPALALTLAAAAPAPGGPLRLEWVAAETPWVVHVDFEALRESVIGGHILEHGEEMGIDLSDLDEMDKDLGFDPRTDLLSATIYGTDPEDHEEGVLVAVTTEAVEEALDRLGGQLGVEVKRKKMHGHTVHVVHAEGERHYVHIRPLERRDRRLVVLSEHRSRLLDAIAVIDGDEPALSMGRSTLLAPGPMPGSIAFVAAQGLEHFDDIEPASEIMRLSEAIVIDLGETDGDVDARVSISADTPEDAVNIVDVVRGMAALGRLMAGSNPDLAPLRALADAVDTAADGRRITIRFRYDAHAVLEMMETLDEMDRAEHGEDEDEHEHEHDHDDDDDEHDDD